MDGVFSFLDPALVGGLVALALFAAILLALRFGRVLGQRALERYGDRERPSLGSLETAVFALLGLLIAFTFSGALERFDVRRGQAVDEANAIGTAWLRIDLMPASAQPAMRDAFRRYVDARIATYEALPDIAKARAELARSQTLQGEIWRHAVAALRSPDARPSGEMLMVPALNAMFDVTTVRTVATQMHPPTIVYAMLCALAIASALLAGYQAAGGRGYDRVHKLGFAAIVALTVYVILDIEYPRLGFVRLDAIDQVLLNVRASMN